MQETWHRQSWNFKDRQRFTK